MAKAKDNFITLDGPNKITVGTVPLELLTKRRENYRKMNKVQRDALRASMKNLGFQSFIQVVKRPDGTYGIIDGHHRVEELHAMGATVAPVILLPEGTTERQADLAMLSFNVSADIKDDVFSSMILDLIESGPVDEVREHAAISAAFMDQLTKALGEPMPGDEPIPTEGSGGSPAPKAKKVPPTKVVVIFAETADGKVPVMFCATHKDTLISAATRDSLAAQDLTLDEIEPVWFSDEDELLHQIESAAAEAGAGEDAEEDPEDASVA